MELQTKKGASKSTKVPEAAPRARQQAPQKMKLCMYHLQGVCKYSADACSFAHTTEEMRVGRGSRRAAQATPGGHSLEALMEQPVAASRTCHLGGTECKREGSFEANRPRNLQETKQWPELTEPAFIKPSGFATDHNQSLGAAAPSSDFAVPQPGTNIDYGGSFGVPGFMQMRPASLASLAYTSDTAALGLLTQSLADREARAAASNSVSQHDLKALYGSIDRLATIIEQLKRKGQAAPNQSVGESPYLPGAYQQHDVDLHSDLGRGNTQLTSASNMLGASLQWNTTQANANTTILAPPGLTAHNWPAQAVGA